MVYLQTVMQRSKVCARIILHVCVTNIATVMSNSYVKAWKNAKMEVKVVVKKSTNNYLKK